MEGDQSIHESNVNKQTWKKFIDKVEFQSVTIERDSKIVLDNLNVKIEKIKKYAISGSSVRKNQL